MWSARRRGCARGCCRRPMMCGCWRPAGSRWGWPGRPGTGWDRWRCRVRTMRRGGGGPGGGGGLAARAPPAVGRVGRGGRGGGGGGGRGARVGGAARAIELAAARVEALGVAQLLDRLDDCFGLLAAGDRLAPGRQRSLAATVEWSYQLLDEQERRVFRVISVFPGPFTLEAAEAVAGDDAGPRVLRLVDCSLLVPPRTDPDGRPRYA